MSNSKTESYVDFLKSKQTPIALSGSDNALFDFQKNIIDRVGKSKKAVAFCDIGVDTKTDASLIEISK